MDDNVADDFDDEDFTRRCNEIIALLTRQGKEIEAIQERLDETKGILDAYNTKR